MHNYTPYICAKYKAAEIGVGAPVVRLTYHLLLEEIKNKFNEIPRGVSEEYEYTELPVYYSSKYMW